MFFRIFFFREFGKQNIALVFPEAVVGSVVVDVFDLIRFAGVEQFLDLFFESEQCVVFKVEGVGFDSFWAAILGEVIFADAFNIAVGVDVFFLFNVEYFYLTVTMM